MIQSEKLEPALYALHGALILARTMDFQEEGHRDIAAVLDVAELFPLLIADSADRTADYERYLQDLAEKGFGLPLGRYEDKLSGRIG